MPNQSCDFAADPAHPTIAEEILTYHFLATNNDNGADSYLSHIKFRLRTEPVNEIDVETVWKIVNTPEMIDAVIGNIIKFDVLSTQPAGGYIDLFIETEMQQMHERGQNQLIGIWQKHMLSRHFPTAAKLKGLIYCRTQQAYDLVKQKGKELYIRAVFHDFLKKN
ncbi:hypothetical protein PtrSN002B_009179 [Pyrenophora tritici-repentis]|uniref:Uncharacterized protein n=2 Tax=Pyrenophora tritici-repentis TaxID=45151 RepID=A0A2W1EVK4_9PLEO|nr:uncharacterized protein PTRG_10029 [Pyrenophora tritici-repentis Pt-1C-BFP]KAA8621566.1 hypothetical protein PtrV1_06067 [Pyrenophora tritici-repentis]EDU43080.1 predicted protein [Pyrenophora tritici-repentis Pt-1C-BFP]KAF7450807.1 hypothetical protein A1F99_054230 [Pyrenophora tritici-repentis]KAF7573457.1 hypothetical protein PtrM4_083620 [Pyrenophora tritici-repentis]KAG9380980.1 hypothetical protein A1F94_008300 [Pyrenophora tritici-repentis]